MSAAGSPSEMDPAMVDEFDTVPLWVLEAVRRLGPSYALPAACRGSGGPAALDWLTTRLGLGPGTPLLDVGAGMGGPAAYAARHLDVSPVLVEPMTTACRAAAALFGLPVVASDGARLPFPDRSFAAVWSLGVLCTVEDQAAHLAELARVSTGPIGLLVYERTVAELPDQPEGNAFPSAAELDGLVHGAGLVVRADVLLGRLPDPSPEWQAAAEAVDTWIAARHGHERAWRDARRQEAALASLIDTGRVRGRLLVVQVP